MDARFGRRSMLALAAAGALGRVQNSFGTGWGESGFVWIA
jgi:C1A family cysteine protease